jgi:MarR family transcriptional regulator, transcriptional regulator for hemolysin
MSAMPPRSQRREFAFLLNDVARLLRTYADYKASQFGMTRAQWAVLVRVEHSEGLNQSELAEGLDLQPITLTRLLDKLCDSGLIERRPDPADRRAKRLYLLPAARPLLEQLSTLGEETMAETLAGVDGDSVQRMVAELAVVKENLRRLIAQRDHATASTERRYG